MHVSGLLAVATIPILAVMTTSMEPDVIGDLEESTNITVYYESMCPTSIYFVTAQLIPAWLIFGNQLSVSLKPFGKAEEFCKKHIKFLICVCERYSFNR